MLDQATVVRRDAANGHEQLRFVWLEITGKCQLHCQHCYAASSPTGTHGTMVLTDWLRVLDQAAELGATAVQFIGGEPTMHPGLPILVRRVLEHGMEVEVFTNLVHVTPPMWQVFEQPGISLATSYYSRDARQHNAITGRPSHDRTLSNIREGRWRGIPIRVGIIGIRDEQQVDDAVTEMRELGVANIGVDYPRQVGRGVRDSSPGLAQLCGKCADGSLAVSPTGNVWPCVFSRWLTVGNVHRASLATINGTAQGTRQALTDAFARRPGIRAACDPGCEPKCEPHCWPGCTPNCEPQKCQPCVPNRDGDPG